MGLEARGAGCGVAFAEEMADAVAEFGERAVFGDFELAGYLLSISYCDTVGHFMIVAVPNDNPCVEGFGEGPQRLKPGSHYVGRRAFAESERLAESFLRFVVFVAVAFVEGVGAIADYVGADGHVHALFLAGPILGRLE